MKLGSLIGHLQVFKPYFLHCNAFFFFFPSTRTPFGAVQGFLFSPQNQLLHLKQQFIFHIFIQHLKDHITAGTKTASCLHQQVLSQRSTSHTEGYLLQSTRFLCRIRPWKSVPHSSSAQIKHNKLQRPSFPSPLKLNPAVKRQHRALGFKIVSHFGSIFLE